MDLPKLIQTTQPSTMVLFWENQAFFNFKKYCYYISFYPRPVWLRVLSLPASVSVAVSLSVYQSQACPCDNSTEPVQARITKFGREMQKVPIVFWRGGTIALDLQDQIELKCKNLPHFELVHTITHHQLKKRFPNFDPKFILALLRSLLILGLIDLNLQFQF